MQVKLAASPKRQPSFLTYSRPRWHLDDEPLDLPIYTYLMSEYDSPGNAPRFVALVGGMFETSLCSLPGHRSPINGQG